MKNKTKWVLRAKTQYGYSIYEKNRWVMEVHRDSFILYFIPEFFKLYTEYATKVIKRNRTRINFGYKKNKFNKLYTKK